MPKATPPRRLVWAREIRSLSQTDLHCQSTNAWRSLTRDTLFGSGR
ncbi:MAG: hypothetical protein PVH17_04020 [Anaerolineae bacterium]|jgi:hypothetical protein